MWSGFSRYFLAGAHDWGQVLMFQGKGCSHFRSFTTTPARSGKKENARTSNEHAMQAHRKHQQTTTKQWPRVQIFPPFIFGIESSSMTFLIPLAISKNALSRSVHLVTGLPSVGNALSLLNGACFEST